MIQIQDKSIKQRYSYSKSRINKLTNEVKLVRNQRQHTVIIQRIITVENYIYSKIEPFSADASAELIAEIKELRLDADHYLELRTSYREYSSVHTTEQNQPTSLEKQYRSECRLAATLAGY